jgi:hypothetical protein
MAWTAPLTWVSGAVLTAAQLNQQVRDNMNETAPAKATAANQLFVSTGVNAIAARTPTSAAVDTSETTTSTSFTALTTPGATVSVTTGTKAAVAITATMSNSSANEFCLAGYAVSGATTIAATDAAGIAHTSATSNSLHQGSFFYPVTLTAGTNVFTMQYRVSAGTGTFLRRRLYVFPL